MHRASLPPRSFGKLGKRRYGRLAAPIEGQLQSMAGSSSVITVNVSRTGCQVHIARPVKCGLDVVLRLAALDVMCTVIWARNDRCGLCFHQPLSDAQMEHVWRLADGSGDNSVQPSVTANHYWR
ncbi:MAG: PilZ domain-containing protein [Novosphingobium sp.]|nr:PilZ domain-containing protein [Brevundimonas sp.]